ncbi:MAG: hypothetical protein OEM05_15730 [Myxococcales bacterium]|nr:hypothetical protein [Myxococcales bacterium]
MTRTLAGLLLAAAFLVALFFATRSETAVQCELCIDFGGRTACRTASAADRDAAVQGAMSTACAVLSSGVTQGLECSRTPPRSLRCSE